MSGYSIFNRHEHMSAETLSEIGSILRDPYDIQNFELINQLYGLYDGYLYDELLINAQDLPKDLYRRIIKVWAIVSKYPKVHYFAGEHTTATDGVEVHLQEMEYSENMGVAEGKEYLASLEC